MGNLHFVLVASGPVAADAQPGRSDLPFPSWGSTRRCKPVTPPWGRPEREMGLRNAKPQWGDLVTDVGLSLELSSPR